MGISHNANRVAQRLERMGPAMVREVTQELDRQGQEMARAMQREAPKFHSTLVNSIFSYKPNVAPMTRVIAPDVEYGLFVERGRKPGKGLPAYFDPAAKLLQDWIEQMAGGGPRRKSERQSHELALRDIYMGLSWKVKHHGIKANPFAKRAFDQRVTETAAALKEAAVRGLRLTGVPA